MHRFRLNRRRSQTLLLAIGQLVLIAYVFQVAAFDHWHATSPTDVSGVPGTSAHSTIHDDHCHGGPSSCAESGGGFAHVSPHVTLRLPGSTPMLAIETDFEAGEPGQALILPATEPPRPLT